jgi:MarR family transcriptional regulator for hemolysin
LTSTLMQAGRQWRRLAQEALDAYGISEARAAPLVWVSRMGGSVRQVELASRTGIEGTSLVRLLDQLSAAGLVERRSDPEDRRAKTIWLTDEGERLAERVERVLVELRDRVLSDVKQSDVEAALRVFQAINRASTRCQTEIP